MLPPQKHLAKLQFNPLKHSRPSFAGSIAGLAAASATVLLAACGGGGSGTSASASTVSSSGTAAIGKALSNATVNLSCAQGSGSTQTNAAGNYSLTINGVAPCLLSIQNNGITLRSVLPASGSSNITPLTTLLTDYLIARAGQQTGASDAVLISNNNFLNIANNNSAIGDGILAVRNYLRSVYLQDVGTNFLSETIATPQSGQQNQPDRLLDLLAGLNGIEPSGLSRPQDRQAITMLGTQAGAAAPQSGAQSASGDSTEAGTGTGTAVSIGLGTSVGTGVGTGSPISTGTGNGTGVNTGTNTGTNTGINTGIGSGVGTGSPIVIDTGINSGTVSSAKECFNPTLYETGSRQELTYEFDTSGIKTVIDYVFEVKGRTFFEGKNLLEIETRAGQEKFSGFFEADLISGIITSFGVLGTSLSGGESVTTKTVETDPLQYKDATLNAGQSYSEFGRSETVSIFNDRPGKPQEKFVIEQQQQVTYIGREQVTVPAGTFNACKFRERQFNNSAFPVDLIRWTSPQGIKLKAVLLDENGREFNPEILLKGKINGMDIK